MARCPGQDQRFWKPDDIFDVKCPACSSLVEFWKDEPQVRCPNCKHIVINPKLDLGCAKWCKYAEECLGQIGSQENKIISNKLIEYLRKIAGVNQSLVRSSLEILRYAEKIQLEEGGDPLIVKASAILSQVYKRPPETEFGSSNENNENNQNLPLHDVLIEYGIKKEIADSICRILDALQFNEDIDSLEYAILWDSRQLAQLYHSNAINLHLKTRTAKQLAGEISGT